MAGNAFDREILNARERPLSTDINAAQSQLDRSLREILRVLTTGRVSTSSDLTGNPVSGFIGDGCKVRQQAVLTNGVKVTLGIGLQDSPADVPASVGGVGGVDDLSRTKPLVLLADVNISGVPVGPAAGQDRYDIVEVRNARRLDNSSSRDVLNPGTGLFVPTAVNKTLDFTLDGDSGIVTSPVVSTNAVSYKVGTAAATGTAVEPATTAGYVKIATIFSNNGNMTTNITRANIIDRRALLELYNQMSCDLVVSIPSGGATPPSVLAFGAPPGVEVVVLKSSPPNQNIFQVYFLGAGPVLSAVAVGSILQAGLTGSSFNTLNLRSNVNGALDAALVAALADATLSGPALQFPVGHPYVMFEFIGVNQTAGVTSGASGATPNPMVVYLAGTFIRS
jgi:hypothetical protein